MTSVRWFSRGKVWIGIAVGVLLLWVLPSVSVQMRRSAMQESWDANVGRPEAVTVVVGETKPVPAKVDPALDFVNHCEHNNCASTSFEHYPMAYPIGVLFLQEGCYEGHSSVAVKKLQAALTVTGGRYTVTLVTSTTVRICSLNERQTQDRLVLWSDELPA